MCSQCCGFASKEVEAPEAVVPTRNSERAVMIDLRLLIRRSRKLHDRRSPYSAPLAQLDRENPGRSPNRDRRPPSPNQRPQTLRSQPSQTSTLGPTFLDMAVARLARLALRSRPRETGNTRRLASQRFPIPLDLEKPTRASRETFDSQGPPRADPQHEQSQSALGVPRVHGEILKLGLVVLPPSIVGKIGINR
jgi:hypothetical protein